MKAQKTVLWTVEIEDGDTIRTLRDFLHTLDVVARKHPEHAPMLSGIALALRQASAAYRTEGTRSASLNIRKQHDMLYIWRGI